MFVLVAAISKSSEPSGSYTSDPGPLLHSLLLGCFLFQYIGHHGPGSGTSQGVQDVRPSWTIQMEQLLPAAARGFLFLRRFKS